MNQQEFATNIDIGCRKRCSNVRLATDAEHFEGTQTDAHKQTNYITKKQKNKHLNEQTNRFTKVTLQFSSGQSLLNTAQSMTLPSPHTPTPPTRAC